MDQDKKTVEQWQTDKKTEGFLFSAAQAGNGWAQGKELSEAEYDAAIESAGNVQIGVTQMVSQTGVPVTPETPATPRPAPAPAPEQPAPAPEQPAQPAVIVPDAPKP